MKKHVRSVVMYDLSFPHPICCVCCMLCMHVYIYIYISVCMYYELYDLGCWCLFVCPFLIHLWWKNWDWSPVDPVVINDTMAMPFMAMQNNSIITYSKYITIRWQERPIPRVNHDWRSRFFLSYYCTPSGPIPIFFRPSPEWCEQNKNDKHGWFTMIPRPKPSLSPHCLPHCRANFWLSARWMELEWRPRELLALAKYHGPWANGTGCIYLYLFVMLVSDGFWASGGFDAASVLFPLSKLLLL